MQRPRAVVKSGAKFFSNSNRWPPESSGIVDHVEISRTRQSLASEVQMVAKPNSEATGADCGSESAWASLRPTLRTAPELADRVNGVLSRQQSTLGTVTALSHGRSSSWRMKGACLAAATAPQTRAVARSRVLVEAGPTLSASNLHRVCWQTICDHAPTAADHVLKSLDFEARFEIRTDPTLENCLHLATLLPKYYTKGALQSRVR